MSFFVRKSKTDPIENAISADEILTPAERERDYYCPGCSCVFRYRAISSNKRAAHFFRRGMHDADCWMPYAEAINGQIDMNAPKDFSLKHLYFLVTHSKSRSGKGVGTVGGGTKAVTPIKLNTIRNLYKFCCYHDNNHVVGNGLKVKDIFVGKKTSYLYTKYVNGLKLVECSYLQCNEAKKTIYFAFPSVEDERFHIVTSFNDADTFEKVSEMVRAAPSPILILAEWATSFGTTTVYSNILSSKQVVPLRR